MADLRPAFDAAKARWQRGERGRELALHLLFTAWMHWAEPPHLTGLSDETAAALWHEAFAYLGGADSADAEFLYVAGHMVTLFPWPLGDETVWERTGQRLTRRATELQPAGFSVAQFEGRGFYGDYFISQLRPRAR